MSFLKSILEFILKIIAPSSDDKSFSVAIDVLKKTNPQAASSPRRVLRKDMSGEDVKSLQVALKELGFFTGTPLGNFGPLTEEAVLRFQKNAKIEADGVVGPKTWAALEEALMAHQNTPTAPSLPWMDEAKKMLGKKETDPKFNKYMTAKWSLFGMNLPNITESWTAWCGLFVATCLSLGGLAYQADGSLARNWQKYGSAIDYKTQGIPYGAVVWINNKGDCKSSSNNHVTFANGDCTPADVSKPGATFGGLGGNQGNMVKVSGYSMSKICAVRWPLFKWKPELPVKKSKGCSALEVRDESTR